MDARIAQQDAVDHESGVIAGSGRSAARAPFFERRRTERALSDLRIELTRSSVEGFYRSLARRLGTLVGVQCAFVARLSRTPAPSLSALGFWPDEAPGASPRSGTCEWPGAGTLEQAVLDDPDCDLAPWLANCGWLLDRSIAGMAGRALLACDGTPIGIIAIADRGPIASNSAHIRSSLSAFARLAERVLERENAVLAIQRDRGQLDGIIATAMDAIVSVDSQQRIVRFNRAAERMYRRTAAEVIGQPLDILLPIDVRETHRRHVENFASLGTTARQAGALGELRGARADGTEFPAEVAISRADAEGGPIYTAIMRDITERKRALEQLKAAEARFRSLVEQSLAGIFIIQEQRFQYVNPHLAGMLGAADPEEIVRRIPIAELAIPSDRGRVIAMVRECLAGRRQQVRDEFRVLRRDGEVIDVEIHGRTFEYEGRPAIIGVVLDISETKRNEGALRRSEELFRGMFEAMSEGVAVHEFVQRDGRIADYRIVDANPSFEQHTGIRVAEARGRLASELYGTGAAPFLDRYLCLHAGGGPIEFEIYFEPMRRRFSVSAFALDRQRFVSVFQDVTEQRRLEKEGRERAQELGRTGGLLTLGEMASTLAHELNQPLTSIANFSAGSLTRIQNGSASLDSIGWTLSEISEEADRAGKILNGVRKFMRKRDFAPAPVDLNELVREVAGLAETISHDDRIALRLDLEAGLPPVMADRVLLQVVLMNLIRNGFEAMQDTVEAAGELRVTTRMQGPSSVEVQVIDSGCGLPPQDADEVFRAFFSTKREGLGLGLAITRSIVESHGGTIWACRNEVAGSTFHFTLATSQAPPQ
jgi:PAS domain S-box-containing protein